MPTVSQFRLTEKQLAELKKGFSEVDRDGNGRIDRAELMELFEKMFGNDDDVDIEASVEAAFGECDIDGDGYIDFEEYIQLSLNSE